MLNIIEGGGKQVVREQRMLWKRRGGGDGGFSSCDQGSSFRIGRI